MNSVYSLDAGAQYPTYTTYTQFLTHFLTYFHSFTHLLILIYSLTFTHLLNYFHSFTHLLSYFYSSTGVAYKIIRRGGGNVTLQLEKNSPSHYICYIHVCFTYEYTYWEQNALYLVNCKHFTTYRLIFSKTFVYPQTDQCNLIFQARNF